MNQMNMQPVTSTNVAAVGYDTATSIMRVAFHSGGVWDYFNINPALFEQMLLPYPWRRIGGMVKAHRHARIAA